MFRLAAILGFFAWSSMGFVWPGEFEAARQLREIGGHTFLDPKSNRIVEVNLNRNLKVTDETLSLVAACSSLTDLSLEETAVGDAGIGKIANLENLEWLNLFRTKVTDKALSSLSGLPSLQHLPIGETAITDRGMADIFGITTLQYLGLRGNRITDRGISGIGKLVNLKGLHLGQTLITDQGIVHLHQLKKLERLWLLDTPVTAAAITPLMEKLPLLKELHLQRTHLKIEEIQRLRRQHPKCDIRYERD